MANVDAVLAERGKRYGDFRDHARIAQQIQDTFRQAKGWERLNYVQAQALTVIADKIARILSGDPNYDDNWIDIQGYAKLVQDRLVQKVEWQEAEVAPYYGDMPVMEDPYAYQPRIQAGQAIPNVVPDAALRWMNEPLHQQAQRGGVHDGF